MASILDLHLIHSMGILDLPLTSTESCVPYLTVSL